MKQKLFTLMTLLLCLCSGAWATAGDSASEPATKTLNGQVFLDVANTPYNATITSGTIRCVTYGIYYLCAATSNGWRPSWVGGATSNMSASTSSSTTDFSAQGFLPGAQSSLSTAAERAVASGYGYSNAKQADNNTRYIYVTGITGVAMLNKDDSNESRNCILKVEEYNQAGTATTDLGTTTSGNNSSYHVTEYDAATLSGDKYYKITLSGSSSSGGCGQESQIRFIQYKAPSTPTLTGAFSPASAEVSKGDDAPTLPTYTVTASDASETAGKYNVTYSLKAGSTEGIFTYTAEDGISAISTATAGTATIVATLSNPADGYSIGTATAEYTVTVNNVLEAVSDYTWDFTSSSEFPGASTSEYTAETYVNNVMIGKGATLRIAEDSKPQRLMLNNKATASEYYVKIKVASHSRVTVSAVGGSGRNIYFAENAVGGTQLAKLSCTNSSAQDKVLGNSGDGEKVICIYNKDGNDNKYNITLYSIKVEPASVSGTITESGWNTFSSNQKLDLSKISGGTAYVAITTSDKSVTMSECTDIVAPGTGLMIKGNKDETFTIETTSSAATFSGDNLLVGLPNGGTVTKDDNNYVFAWPTGKPENCGFYFVNDFQPTLPAGKAYLHTTAPHSKQLAIVFEGETTGISNLNVNDNDNIDANAPMYNLAGQKVSKNYKGIVIVNGKKVVRK